MLIAIPVFSGPDDRRYDLERWLDAWWRVYERSGNTYPVVLLSDGFTDLPPNWDVEIVPEPEPPSEGRIQSTSDWYAAQAFGLLGPVICVDLDLFIKGSLSEIEETTELVMMAPRTDKPRAIHHSGGRA